MIAEYTPLDSLKEMYWRTENLLGYVRETLATEFEEQEDDDYVHEADPWLEATEIVIFDALARHIPGMTRDGDGLKHYSADAITQLLTYDDGTPVKTRIASKNGWMVDDYYPRRDGTRWAFEARLNDRADQHAKAAAKAELAMREGQNH